MATKNNAHRFETWLFAGCLLVSILISGFYYHSLVQQSLKDINQIITIYADRTGNLVNAIFHKTDTLAAVVKLQNGNISEKTFQEIAKLVYAKNSGIRGIQYMPGAVVTYSYPVEGNEGVIGKNFLKIPERLKDVRLAIDTKSIALSGPYNLLQGGLGVVARNPVFLTDANGKEYFWGFSAIILDLPDALDAAGLGNLTESGYDFQLFCINENGERLVISGNPRLDTNKAELSNIQVPHHEWTLAVAPLHPWHNLLKAGALFLLCLFVSLGLWTLFRILRQKEAAIQAKNTFFSDISHDMRTPLNAVIGFSNLAQAPEISAQEKDVYLAKIQSAGKLLLDLINDTLVVSKAGSGKLQLQLEPVATKILGTSIMETICVLAEQKKIAIVCDERDYRPRIIMADRLALQKVFLNLLNNAVKFTPPGGHVQVNIADIPSGGKDADLLITIKDDGIGISPQFLPHIYEPFVQEQRTGYAGTGNGLGLAIVKQYVDVMGGTIKVTSSLGKGTTFIVQLPFKEVEAQAEEKTEEDIFPEVPDIKILSGRKVLLCEDNELNKQIAVALLKRKKMVIETAVDGKAGVEKFTQSAVGEFSAILMDIRMPVMDGYEAARVIRLQERPDAQSIPIIAMTADVFEENIKQCLDAGMDAHIAKPIDPEVLYATLVKMM